MATFHYQAAAQDGAESQGSIEAADRGEALSKLKSRGLQPFALTEQGSNATTESTTEKPVTREAPPQPSTSPVRLSRSQVILFTEDLANLLNAGMQLEPALRSMENRKELSDLKTAVGRIAESVRDGNSFAQALKWASPSFGELYCSVVAAGEVSGSLPSILNRQARHLATVQELRAKVSFALIYPAFLFVSGIAVAILFSSFLIPKLSELVESTGSTLPPVASLIVGISNFMQTWWWLVLGIVVVVCLLGWQWTRSRTGRPWWDRIKLRLPVVGPVFVSNFCVQFLEMLSNLIQNGMPLLRSLELVTDAIQNRFLKTHFETITEEVRDGASLSHALDHADVTPQLLSDMVRIGEQTGDLGQALDRAAEQFERDLGKRIQTVNALVQPAIILLMALLVGGMAYLMITVIYDTLATVRAR